MTQDQLNALAKIKYESEIYSGWTKDSSFVTFGYPRVHIGNKIQLTSAIYPEKNGIYMCTSIKTSIGMDGYRQEIGIGPSINK